MAGVFDSYTKPETGVIKAMVDVLARLNERLPALLVNTLRAACAIHGLPKPRV